MCSCIRHFRSAAGHSSAANHIQAGNTRDYFQPIKTLDFEFPLHSVCGRVELRFLYTFVGCTMLSGENVFILNIYEILNR